jgi:hypothetical protein
MTLAVARLESRLGGDRGVDSQDDVVYGRHERSGERSQLHLAPHLHDQGVFEVVS